MVNLKTKYRLVTVTLLGTLAVIIFCLYYLKDLATNINAARVNIAETQRDIALIDKVTNDMNLYMGDINKLKNTLPSRYFEVAFFTSQLETLAGRNNLSMQVDINEKAVEEKGMYSSISYSLELNGSFSSISEFLSQVAKLPYHTTVSNLNMSIKNGGLVGIVEIKLFIEK